MILQSTGENFRRRGRTVVDQHHDRQPFGHVAFGGVIFDGVFLVARTGGNDFPLVKEQIGNRYRLVKQAARVVAHVDYQSADAVFSFFLHLGQSVFYVLVHFFAEGGNADIGNVFGFDFAFNRLDFDFFAFQGDVKRFFGTAADGQFDFGAGFAAHFVDRFVKRHADDGGAVEADDVVARFQPGFERRRVVDRRNHFDHTAFHRHLNAQAAEFSLRLLVEILEAFGVKKAGMRIKRGKHAVDGRFDQFLVAHLFHVRRFGPFHDFAEKVQHFIGVGFFCRRRLFVGGGYAAGGQDDVGD